jgi:hypothetical protein
VLITINGNKINKNIKSSEISVLKAAVQQLLEKSDDGRCASTDGRLGECVTTTAFADCGVTTYEVVNSSECNPEVSKKAYARCCVPKKEIVPVTMDSLCKGRNAGDYCGLGDKSGTCNYTGDKLFCIIKSGVTTGFIRCQKDSGFYTSVISCTDKYLDSGCKVKTFDGREIEGICRLDQIQNNGNCFCYVKEGSWLVPTSVLTSTPKIAKPTSILDTAPDYAQYFDAKRCTRTGCRARCCAKSPPAPVTDGSGCRGGMGLFPYCECGDKLNIPDDEAKYIESCKNYDFLGNRKKDKENPSLNFDDDKKNSCEDEECNDNCQKNHGGLYTGKCKSFFWIKSCTCYDEYGKRSI